MGATVRLIGNEGFHLSAGGMAAYVDAFHGMLPLVAGGPGEPNAPAGADLILVTHAHWDHFDQRLVAEAARRTGASVVGPASIIAALAGKLPGGQLIELEPPPARAGKAAGRSVSVRGVNVTAFRTRHSRDHNSYLVEMPGLRFFHDGDNEDTRCLDPAALRGLDALLIGPWQGSGWVDFVEAVRPKRYFLMHLTDQELDEHDAGTFLTETCGCARVPEGLVVLRPGQAYELA
jgi:L-ascorbate metabolism protein UlaG (beta-lactamase superfamily)